MDDLLTDFIAETRDMMNAIEGEIIAWEAAPSDGSRLDAIFRFVHTVKGNCGFFDFPRLERVSHAAEDALSDVRAGRRIPDSAFVSAILAILDCINEMVQAIEEDTAFPPGREEPLLTALALGQETEFVAAPTSPNAKQSSTTAAPRSIRLPVDLLDRVMSGVSDMVLARNDLAHRLRQAGNQPMIDGPFERLTTILGDVRDAITRMRMQPVEQLFASIPRIVRDLSQDLGKQVMIDIEGGDVELDREVIELIRDPVMHIIRNAVDHGFEKPAERLKAGKREIGLLRVAARQTGNRIVIAISDDGRGLDEEKIAYKALANHLITPDQHVKMDTAALQQLIFEPGLSTADEVSTVSGRGVGMDIVRENLERVGGSIEVTSTKGNGTTLYLHIPLTLSIIAGLVVEVGGQHFALPQSLVEEVELGEEGGLEFTRLGDANVVTMRGAKRPSIDARTVLGMPAAQCPESQSYILIKLAKGDHFALAVDEVHNIGDLVVKPLPDSVMKTGCYSGSALLDDGQPILLLDIPQIAQDHGIIDPNRPRIDDVAVAAQMPAPTDREKAMVFIALDGHRKAARMETIQRIETIAANAIDHSGPRPNAVIKGIILPLAGLDDIPLGDAKVRCLRLSDGTSELLYAMREVEDTIALDTAITPPDGEPFIEGKTLINGCAVALLDAHALFAAFGVSTGNVNNAVCSLPDTEWARGILAPLVESGGYTVTYGSDTADVAIVIDQQDAGHAAKSDEGNVIHLRSSKLSKQEADAATSSIYRYDRDGLLQALRTATAKGTTK